MDYIASELKMSRLKQSKIGKAYESLTLQWKDLDEHFESTQNSLQIRFRELEDREKDVAFREKRVEVKETTFNSQMESKAKKLHEIDKLIQERQQEAEKGKNDLLSIQSLTQEYSEELRGKKSLCEEAGKLVGVKERKLKWVEKTLKDKSKELDYKEREIQRVKRVLNKSRGEIEFKRRQLNLIQGSIEERKKEYDFKQEQMIVTQRSMEEWDNEMKLKAEKLSLFQESIAGCSKNLDEKEKMIKAIDLKVRDFCLLQKSMVEWSHKLELKESKLEGWVEKLELKEKQIESKVKELNLIDKRVNECLTQVQEREKHLDSLEKSVQECSHGLEIKERQLEKQARELDLKQKQFESTKKSKEKANILASQVKIEHGEHIPADHAIFPLSASNPSSINIDGRALQLFMKEHLNRINSVGVELAALLQGSPDPAYLVLDAMQGFYPSNPTVDSRKFDFELNVIRKSCILLLEGLKRMSPQINPLAKEQAMKLAADWKAKMTGATDNRLEVLGLLRLLAAYELTSTYDVNELQTLLAIVPEHATELCQDLGITDKAPASSIICSPVEIETPESSLAKNAETFSSSKTQIISTTDAKNHLMRNETSDTSERSSDPAKLVLDVMQTSLAEYWTKGDVGSKATAMLSNISLLDQLMRVSPHVGPDVKEDAMKLAIQWKAELGAHAENSLEVLGFLQFIATYGFLSTFNGGEISVLLGRISQHKQALEIFQTLCFADKIPNFIQNLIERKKFIEAVRLIFTFELIDKFPPIPLLEAYVEYTNIFLRERNSLDDKEMVVDYKIAVLRAVIQCIKEYNLESEYPSRDIEVQIVGLEKLKENRRLVAPSIASNVERQEQKKGKKRSSSTFAPEFQPQQQRRSICHGAALSDAGPPGFLQSRLVNEISGQTKQFADNHGHPGQFGMVAND